MSAKKKARSSWSRVHNTLGWEVWDDYLGVKSLRHTGNSFGFTTGVRIVEEEDGLRDFAVQWKPVGHTEAEAYLGSYTHAASVLRSDEGLQLRTDYGDFELFATEQPGLLGIGGVLSGIIVIQRDDATPNTLTLGMPGGESLSWPLTIERLHE